MIITLPSIVNHFHFKPSQEQENKTKVVRSVVNKTFIQKLLIFITILLIF